MGLETINSLRCVSFLVQNMDFRPVESDISVPTSSDSLDTLLFCPICNKPFDQGKITEGRQELLKSARL